MKKNNKKTISCWIAEQRRILYSLYERNILIKNLYNTNYPKTALLSYVVRPFIKPFKNKQNLTHTNQGESKEIAKTLKKLGYNIDIISYNSNKRVDYNRYDLIFGFGEPLINSFYRRERNIFTIYYGTGMHLCHQNHATLKRIEDVYRKKSKWLLGSGRIVDRAWSVQTSLVDAMIVLGNEVTTKSYRKYFSKPTLNIPASCYQITNYKDIVRDKDFSISRKHFLWFGGGGLIHKGLDLLLEVFRKTHEIHLHICGPVKKEKEFDECFHKELYETENIHTYDFISLDSKTFFDLMRKCAFVVLPSCSEGGTASVVNVMANGGLIPVITKETGIDLKYGIEINTYDCHSIKLAIEKCSNYTIEDLKRKSLYCGEKINRYHSISSFSAQLESALEKVLPN